VTADVESFCHELSNLYSSIFKPILDIALNTLKLSSMMGLKAPVILFGYYLVLGQFKMAILRVVNLKAQTQRQSELQVCDRLNRQNARFSIILIVLCVVVLQGNYRTAHSRLITYSEEIAFFEGSQREQVCTLHARTSDLEAAC
jgi:ATP-binding cassette subfamily D (ALD) protein 3